MGFTSSGTGRLGGGAPAELEAVLCGHAEIADAGVVSIYDGDEATELPRSDVIISSLGIECLMKSQSVYCARQVIEAHSTGGESSLRVGGTRMDQEAGRVS